MDYNGILIAYGSQTGQSESIAREIVRRAQNIGFPTRIHTLNECNEKFFIDRERLIVIVCSSTGDGEPPDNAVRFLRFITQKSHPPGFLENTSYALLGLGDSNYSTFQGNPRLIDNNLLRLGAKKLIETGIADDQIGLESAVEPWIEKLFDALQKHSRVEAETNKLANIAAHSLNIHSINSSEGMLASIEEALCVEATNWSKEPCIVKGKDTLQSDANLRVPVASKPYIQCQYYHDTFDVSDISWQNGCGLVGAISGVYDAKVLKRTALTDSDVAKPKFELIFSMENQLEYEPGDAFYIVAPNSEAEVNFLLHRIGMSSQADEHCRLSILSTTEKRNAVLPPYIPENSTLRYIFTHCLDIRRSPGRPLLRVLAEYTSDAVERRRILELCSAQGVHEFTAFVRQAGISLVDFLLNFPSCRPNASRLIELLPRLLPRPYSVASIQEKWKNKLRFVISLMPFHASEGRRYFRYGHTSGWLSMLSHGQIVKVLQKEASNFRLPPHAFKNCDEGRIPLILIAAGTGIAPYLSFLEKLEILRKKSALHPVPRLLFFGCRNAKKDGIYLDELNAHVEHNILTLTFVCESQPAGNNASKKGKYVQHAIEEHAEEIAKLITGQTEKMEEKAVVYVCGSVKELSKSVASCFMKIITQYMGKNSQEAANHLLELRKSGRYIEDVW